MNKVIVIGCPGAGKSTFARALQKKTSLPLYYLDMLYWNSDRTTVSKEIFRKRLKEVLALDSWIIDGNYGSTIEMRLQECDTVFFLDYDLEICIEGVKMRMGKKRPDMPWTETENDEEFLEFIRSYNTDSRPKVVELLDKYKDSRQVVIFRSREEAEEYLREVKKNADNQI